MVQITKDEIQITSFPGPERSITDEDIARGILRGKRYRNRRIGDFLKELHLVEGRNTGIPTVRRALALNGSPPALYTTDGERSYFEVTLQIHPSFKEEATAVQEQEKMKRRRSREEIESDVVLILSDGEELSTNELSKRLGYRSISKSLSLVVSELVEKDILEYTQPEQLTSPKQRLRLKKD